MMPSYPEAVSDAARKGSILGLFTGVRGIVQPVEKLLYAPSEHPTSTQKARHRSVLALMSKCLDAVVDYPPVL